MNRGKTNEHWRNIWLPKRLGNAWRTIGLKSRKGILSPGTSGICYALSSVITACICSSWLGVTPKSSVRILLIDGLRDFSFCFLFGMWYSYIGCFPNVYALFLILRWTADEKTILYNAVLICSCFYVQCDGCFWIVRMFSCSWRTTWKLENNIMMLTTEESSEYDQSQPTPAPKD